MAMAMKPRLLLLDEPMAGLGHVESQMMITALLAAKGTVPMLLVEHDMEAVFALADRISVLVHGRVIASGTVDEIRANPGSAPGLSGRGGRLMLSVRALQAAYGASQVLFDINFDIRDGEVVTLMGRNGMGKTTTVRAIMGLLPMKSGSILFDDRPIGGACAREGGATGFGLVPEGRQDFRHPQRARKSCGHGGQPAGCGQSVDLAAGL